MRGKNVERLNDMDVADNNIHWLVYNNYHKDLADVFEKYANGRLLDIGCGNKPYKVNLKNKVSEYIGVDIVQSSDNKVDYLCPANKIPLENCSFDIVMSTQTIEHVEDHQGLVNEAFRLLKPGGVFILSGPLYWPLHEEPYDFFRFTKYGFKYILEKAGFEILETRSNGGTWAVAGQAFLHAFLPSSHNIKGIKGIVIRELFKAIGGVKGINKLFSKLDDEIGDESSTMNYVIVAKKN